MILGLAVLTALPAVFAHVTSRPFNISLSDMDAGLTYTPPVLWVNIDAPIDRFWNLTYAGTPTTLDYPAVGEGRTTHRTTLKGATVQMDFVGTAIYFWGVLEGDGAKISFDVDRSRYTMSSVDRPIMPGSDNVTLLAFADGLELKTHTALLTLEQGDIRFNNVTVTTMIDSEAKDTTRLDTLDLEVYHAIAGDAGRTFDPSFTFVTDWGYWHHICSHHEPGGMDCPRYYTRVGGKYNDSSVSFMTKPGASFMQMYLSCDWSTPAHRITVDPLPPFMTEPAIFQPYTVFTSRDITMFTSILDSSISYKVTLDRKSGTNGEGYIILHGVSYTFNTCSDCAADERNTENDNSATMVKDMPAASATIAVGSANLPSESTSGSNPVSPNATSLSNATDSPRASEIASGNTPENKTNDNPNDTSNDKSNDESSDKSDDKSSDKSNNNNNSDDKTNGTAAGKSTISIGGIAGGVVAGVLGLILIVIAILFFCRGRSRRKSMIPLGDGEEKDDASIQMEPPPPSATAINTPLSRGLASADHVSYKHHFATTGGLSISSGRTTSMQASTISYPNSSPLTEYSSNGYMGSPTTTDYTSSSGSTLPSNGKAEYRRPFPGCDWAWDAASGSGSVSRWTEPEYVVEELEDAGRIVEFVPPRYNERWRNETEAR